MEDMRPEGSPHELEQRRLRAIELLRQGLQPHEVAARLGVDRRSVRRWKAAARKGGSDALKAKPAPGRPAKLSAAQRRALVKIVLKGPMASGFRTDLWTCQRIAQLVRSQFGVDYHPDHLGRILHSCGLTPQRPHRRAKERDEQEIARWVQEQWPRLEKKPAASGRTSSSRTKPGS
jgi:transposase